MPYAEIPRRVIQRTVCGVNWPANVTLAWNDRVPAGATSPLFVAAEWPGPESAGVLVVELPDEERETAGSAVFAGEGEPRERRVEGNVAVLFELQGERASPESDQGDVPLTLHIGEEDRDPIRFHVAAPRITLTLQAADGSAAPEDFFPNEEVALKAALEPAPEGETRWFSLDPEKLRIVGEAVGPEVTVEVTESSPDALTLVVVFTAAGPSEKKPGETVVTVHRVMARTLEERLEGGDLHPRHLQDEAIRAALEALSPAEVQRLIDRAQVTDAPQEIRDYLDRLLVFANTYAPLREAPAAGRQSVTFLMGGAGDAFYDAAEQFFLLHPAGQLVRNVRSLTEVRDWLERNQDPNDPPWGEVSIVVHANELGGMQTQVFPGGPEASHFTLEEARTRGDFQPLGNDVVDAQTLIRVRGCAVGNFPQTLVEMSKAFGGDEVRRPVVRAPKLIQGYAYDTVNNQVTAAAEFLLEFWIVGYPANQVPAQDAPIVADFAAQHGNVINWAQALQAGPPQTGTTPHADPFHARRTRTFTYEYPFWPVPANDAALGQTLTNGAPQFAPLAGGGNFQETARNNNPTGTVTIDFSFTSAQGAAMNSSVEFGRPGVGNQAQRDAFLQSEQDLVDALAAWNFVPNDFHWGFVDNVQALPGGVNQDVLVATGNRRIIRVERELLEPDPANPGQQRRAQPAVTDLNYFAEEVPVPPPPLPLGQNVPVEAP